VSKRAEIIDCWPVLSRSSFGLLRRNVFGVERYEAVVYLAASLPRALREAVLHAHEVVTHMAYYVLDGVRTPQPGMSLMYLADIARILRMARRYVPEEHRASLDLLLRQVAGILCLATMAESGGPISGEALQAVVAILGVATELRQVVHAP